MESSLKGRCFCNANDIMNATDELKRLVHIKTSRNVSCSSTVAGRSVKLHKGAVLKEIYLTSLYCFVCLKNTVIPSNILQFPFIAYVPPTLLPKSPNFFLQHIRVFRAINACYLSVYH